MSLAVLGVVLFFGPSLPLYRRVEVRRHITIYSHDYSSVRSLLDVAMTTAASSVIAYLPREKPSISLPLRKRLCMRSSLQETGMRVVRVVWAKLAGYSPWPARVIPENLRNSLEAYVQADGARRSNDDTLVHFFGTDDLAWVNEEKAILPWSIGLQLSYDRRELRKLKRKLEFEKALTEADSFLSEIQ